MRWKWTWKGLSSALHVLVCVAIATLVFASLIPGVGANNGRIWISDLFSWLLNCLCNIYNLLIENIAEEEGTNEQVFSVHSENLLEITNKVYFDIAIDGKDSGRITTPSSYFFKNIMKWFIINHLWNFPNRKQGRGFGLFGKTVPKTAENFRALCTLWFE